MPQATAPSAPDTGAIVSTVAAGATGLGTQVELGSTRLLGFVVGAWSAAPLTFKVSHDGKTWSDLRNPATDTEVVFQVQAGKAYYLPDPMMFAAWPFVQPRSGTSSAPVNQTAGATLTMISHLL